MTILRRLYKSCLLLAVLTASSGALPEGPDIQSGSVTIQTQGGTQTITQSSNKAIINWNGFNIDVGELVHFVQPSSLSAVLNRVIGQDPSVILGSLRANGQVFLINPNGVVFGQTANVDVGSLVVSTLNITDDDFLAGNLNFTQEADKELASVINHGRITIDDNGFLVLTGPMVANDGVILAKVGQVALAAGTKSTVSFDPTGMIQLELPTGAEVGDGIVSLDQATAGDLISNVVSTSISEAGQLVDRDGQLVLEVASGTLVNAGEIRADGQANEDAGKILIDSSANTLLSPESLLSASGVGENSNGGEIFVLSDGVGISERGSVAEAKGGLSGDGGFVEQSTNSGVMQLSVDVSAENGEGGTFLIDPERIYVQAGGGGDPPPLMNTIFIPEDIIESFVGATQTLQTEDGIFFENLVGNELTLQADQTLNIILDGPGDGGLGFEFQNSDATPDRIVASGSGGINIGTSSTGDLQDLLLVTDSGNITVQITTGADIVGDTQLITNSGNINIIAATSEILGTSTTIDAGTGGVGVITSNSTLSLASVSGLLNGTNAADNIDINANRAVNLGGLTNTGNQLDISALSFTQTNQTLTNTGDFGLTTSLGDIGGVAAPVRIDGSVAATAIGDVFLESVNSLTLLPGASNDLTVTGNTIVLSGTFNASGDLSVTSDTSITTPSGRSGGGRVNATNVTLSAPEVGTSGGFLDTGTDDTLTVTANNALIDERGGAESLNIVVNNTQDPTLGSTSINIQDFSEGSHFSDDGTALDRQSSASLTATVVGDRTFDPFGLNGTVNLTATPDSMGSALLDVSTNFGNSDLTLTANDVIFDDLFSFGGTLNATALAGDVTVTGSGPFDVTANATGTANISTTGALTSSGGITAPTVILNALDINLNTATNDLTADASNGNINISNTVGGDLLLDAAAIALDGGNGNLLVTSDGNINTEFVRGDASVTLATTAPGNITSVLIMDIPTDIQGGTIDLTADGAVDVNTQTRDLTVNANGDVRVDNFDPTVESTTDAIIMASSNSVTLNTNNGLDANITASSVTVTGADIVLDTNATTISAISNNLLGNTGDVDILATSATGATVTGFADDDFFLFADGDITVGAAGIAADDVFVLDNSLFGGISGPGTITAPTVDILSDDINITLANATDIDAIADANIAISNSVTGNTVVLLASLGTGDVSYDGGDTITVEKIFANNGNITVNSPGSTIMATNDPSSVVIGELFTPPGNTLSAINGTIDLTGTAITANVTTPTLSATSSTGDIIIGGDDNMGIDVTANSTMGGDVTVNDTSDVTGTLNGVNVNVMANSVDVDLGTSVATVDATATGGLVDLAGNSANLEVTASAPIMDSVTVSNTGGNIATNQITGASVSITASGDITRTSGDLSGPSSVTLNGGNITAQTATGVLSVVGSGNVDIQNSAPGLLTAGITTTGNVDLSNTGAISALPGISGAQVGVTALGGGQGPPSSVTGTIDGTTSVNINADSAIVNSDTPIFTANILMGNLDVTSNVATIDFDVIVPFGSTTVANTGGDITGILRGNPVNITASDSINVSTFTPTVVANATNDIVVVGNFTPLEITADSTMGDVTISNNGGRGGMDPGNITANNITGDNVSVTTTNGSVTTNLGQTIAGNSVTLSGLSVNADIQATQVDGTATAGDVTLTGTNANLDVTASATGDVNVTNSGNISTNNVSGGNINLNTQGAGDITRTSGTVTGTTAVTLTGNAVTSDVDTSNLQVTAANDISINNASVAAANTVNLNSSGGSVGYTGTNAGGSDDNFFVTGTTVTTVSTGDALGFITATTSAGVTADNVNLNVTTPEITANATVGSVTLTGANASLTVGGSAVTSFEVDNNGNVAHNQVTADSIDLDTLGMGDISFTSGALTANTVTLTGNSVTADTETPTLNVTASTGIDVDNDSAAIAATLNTSAGDVAFTTTGSATGLSANGDNVNVSANGAVQGAATGTTSVTASGQSVDLDTGTTDSVTADSTAGNVTLQSTAANLTLDAQAVGGDLGVTNSVGSIAVDQAAGQNVSLAADSGSISTNLGQTIAGSTGVVLNAQTINADVQTPQVSATATSGDVTLTGSNANLDVTASAIGDVNVTNSGNIATNNVSGDNVDLDTQGSGNITRTSGTVTGTTSVTLDGNAVTSTVDSSTVNSTGTGDINITNASAAASNTVTLNSSGGAVTYTGINAAGSDDVLDLTGTVVTATSTGDASGQVNASTTADITANNINLAVTTPLAEATALTGSVNLTGSNATLAVTGTAVTNFDVTNTGNIAASQITAADIDLDTQDMGDITNAGGRLVASNSVTLNGTNVSAQTEAGSLDVTASGLIVIDNFVTDPIDPVSLVAGGDIFFTTVGDANFSTLSGTNISLNLGGAITGVLTGNVLNLTGTSVDVTVASGDVTATATSGDVTIAGSNDPIDVTATANLGSVTVNNAGTVNTNQITAANDINIDTQGMGDITNSSGTLTANTVTLSGNNVAAETEASTLNVTGTTGITVNNDSAAVAATLNTSAGDVAFTTTGSATGLSASGDNVNVSANGALQGTATGTTSVTASGQSVDLNTGATGNVTADSTAGNVTLQSTAANLTLDAQAVGGDLGVTNTVGSIAVDQAAGQNVSLTADSGSISTNLGQTIAGSTGVTLNAQSINADIQTPQVSANATSGDVTLTGSNANLDVTASAIGDVNVTNSGNIATNNISGDNVDLDTQSSGNITRASGTITGTTSVTLDGNAVTSDVDSSTVNSSATGDININNASTAASNTVTLNSSGGAVTYTGTNAAGSDDVFDLTGTVVTATSTGDASGQVNASTRAVLAADNINLAVTTPQVEAAASVGSVNLTGANANLDVTGTAVTNFDVTNTGDIATNQITAGDIDLDTQAMGDITNTSGRLVGSNSVTLNGTNVSAQTEAGSLDAAASGNIIIDNFVTDPIDPVSLVAGGDVTFSTVGDANFSALSGTNISLNLGGAITGALTGNVLNLTGTSVDVTVASGDVTATATSGDVTIAGSNDPIDVTATANLGSVTVNNAGTVNTNQITAANDINIDTQGMGDITNSSGTLTANTVTLDGNNVAAETEASTLNVTGTTGITVNNDSAAVAATLNTSAGDVAFTTTGSATGLSASGDNVNVSANGALQGTATGTTSVTASGQSVDLNTGATGNVTADSTAGNVTLQSTAANLTLDAQAVGGDLGVTNTVGSIAVDQAAGQNVGLAAANGTVSTNAGQRIVGTTVTVDAQTVNIGTTATNLDLESTSGDLTVDNNSATVNSAQLDAAGNLSFTTSGSASNVNATGQDVNLSATGTLSGAATSNSDMLNVQANTVNLDVTTGRVEIAAGTANATLTGNNADLTVAGSASGSVSVTNTGNLEAEQITAGSINLSAQGGDLTQASGRLSANTVELSGNNIDSQTETSILIANATDSINIDNDSATLASTTLNATNDVNFTTTGNASFVATSGNNVSIGATGQVTGTTGGDNLTVNADSADLTTAASGMSVTANGDVTINNTSASLQNPSITTAGNVSFSSTGDVQQADFSAGQTLNASTSQALDGSFAGNSVTLSGASINGSIDTQNVQSTSTSGDTSLSSSRTDELTVTNSTATDGDYTLIHDGDITFDTIEATNNVTLSTSGDITDTSNTITATGINLTGNNIFVNTQGQFLTVSATGDVTINNTLTNIDALSILGQGNVNFTTDGNVDISQIDAGPFVGLVVGGNIGSASSALSQAFVSGDAISIQAGGSITPDLDNPLLLSGGSSIDISAQGANIAAALEGSLPASAVVVSASSGPVFYNGVQLNAVAPPPAPVPSIPSTGAVVDQIGQQNGQVVDDGSVGSAANDGLVEETPTQKLVAKLTEGTEGGGEGLTTETLMTFEVDELGKVKLTVTEPSIFDEKIDDSESLSADDVLDLDTEELEDVKVTVYYDSTNDQLIMAIDLRADDILELDVSEYQEIPVNLEYSFLGDPLLLVEALRADDIIDLEIEDLGKIPIKLHVEGELDDPSE